MAETAERGGDETRRGPSHPRPDDRVRLVVAFQVAGVTSLALLLGPHPALAVAPLAVVTALTLGLVVDGRAATRLGRVLAAVEAHRPRDAGLDPTAAPRRLGRLTRVQRASVAVVAIALVGTAGLAMARNHHRGDVVVGDEALIALEADGVTSTTPLTGKVTSAVLYGNLDLPDNPGPAEVWTLAPFVWSFGTSFGAWVYAALVNLAAAAVATWAAFRRGGPRWAGATLIVALLAADRIAPGGLTSVLNTRIVAMPLFATIVVAAMVALGDTALLAVLVLLATFVAQIHVGYAPVAMSCLLAAVITVAWRSARHGRGPHLTRDATLAGGVLLLAWLPPLIDQVARTGNLGRLLHARVPHAGAGRAIATVGSFLDPRVVLGRAEVRPSMLHDRPLPLLAALVLGFAGWWWWSRRRLAGPLLFVVLAGVAAAAATAWLTPPSDTAGEHYYWFRAVGLAAVLIVALVALGADDDHRTGPTPRWRAAAAVLGAGLLLVLALPLARPHDPTVDEAAAMAAVRALRPTVDAAGSGAQDQPLAIAHQGGWRAVSTADGLIAALTDDGVPVHQVDTGPAPPGYRTVVVTEGRTRPGEPLARYGTGDPGPDEAALADAVARWVHANGPVRLVGPGALDLESVLDGTAAAVCPAALAADPDRVDRLPPLVLLDLYARGQVTAPDLPFALAERLARWQATRPIDLRDAVAPSEGSTLLLSTSSC